MKVHAGDTVVDINKWKYKRGNKYLDYLTGARPGLEVLLELNRSPSSFLERMNHVHYSKIFALFTLITVGLAICFVASQYGNYMHVTLMEAYHSDPLPLVDPTEVSKRGLGLVHAIADMCML